MMIVMKPFATDDEVRHVVQRVEGVGARAHVSRGEEVTVIGAVGDREHVARLGLEAAAGVDKVVPILKPYKLASSQLRRDQPSTHVIGGRKVGGEHFALIAGPCTVESRDQTLEAARVVKAEVDRKGNAKFFKMVTLYMQEDRMVLGVHKVQAGPNGVRSSASATVGDQKVEVVASVDPKTGKITAAMKTSAAPPPALKAVQVK